MSKNNYAINSFGAGEVSEKFGGRFDSSSYPQACEEVTNFLVYPQGGAARRPGTRHWENIRPGYVFHTLTNATGADIRDFTDARMVPFQAAEGSKINIVVKNTGPVSAVGGGRFTPVSNWYGFDASLGTYIPLYAPYSDVSEATYGTLQEYSGLFSAPIDIRTIQHSQTGNRIYFTHKSFRPFFLQYVPNIYGSPAVIAAHPYVFLLTIMGEAGGGGSSDYDKSALQQPFQSPTFAPTVAASVYSDVNVVTPAGVHTYGVTTVTLTVPGPSRVIIDSGWVGRTIKLSHDAKTTVWLIFAVNTTSKTATLVYYGGAQISSTNINYGNFSHLGSSWELSYWGGSYGFPSAVTCFEGRVIMGGCKGFPDTYYASSSDNIDRMGVRLFEHDPLFLNPILATDPFDGVLRTEILPEIRWLFSGKNITCGTNSREFIIQGPDSSKTIGPTNIQSNAETPHGSAAIQPVRIDNATVFVQRHRRSLRELVYSLDEASFKADDLNIFAEHISRRSSIDPADIFTSSETYITGMAMQQAPLGILWCTDSGGGLLGVTRERNQQVLAWHYHTLGGKTFFTVSGVHHPYQPKVMSVNCLPKKLPLFVTYDISTGAEPDELWMVVKRGVYDAVSATWKEVLSIEVMNPEWRKTFIHTGWSTIFTTQENAPIYMDQTVSGETTTGIVTGLPHSVGSTVSVNLQGHDLGDYVVTTGGTVDFSEKYTDLEPILLEKNYLIGYNYTADLVPMVPEVPSVLGSAMGEKRRIFDVTVQFVRTVSARVGRKASKVQENTPLYNYEQVNFPMPTLDIPRQMHSMEKKINFPPGYEERPRIVIRSDRPLPCEVSHIIVKQVVYEQ